MSDTERNIKAGLIAGFVDEAHGILSPENGYDTDDAYLRAVEYGRSVYRDAYERLRLCTDGSR